MAVDGGTREYELKFKARVADLSRFKKAVNTAAGENRAWSPATLSNRYFDTKDRRLADKGVSIRIRRRADGTAVQTVKATTNGSGGLLDRQEWEQPLNGNELDLAALPTESRIAMGAVLDGELAPVMNVDVERQTKTVRRANALGPDLIVEACADKGLVTAGDASERFAECELELVQGDVSAFFQLAAEINAACPLPLSATSKADRGFRLLEGIGPVPHKVPKFEVTASQTVHQALADIYPTCIGNIVDNEDACLDGTDSEGVHQMRVSIRRLRSSLNIFRKLIDPERVDWMAADLKWLGGSLGPARDWDVYIEEMLGTVKGYGIDEASIRALTRAAVKKQKEAYGLVRHTLKSERYARMIFRLAAFVALEGWLATPLNAQDPLLQPLRTSAPGILRRPYKKLLRDAQGLAQQDMETRHEVRIRLKKLRYAVDFLGGAFPGGGTKKFTKALRDLQDQFGHLNDVAQAMRMTDELTQPDENGKRDEQLQLAAGQVRGWFARALQDTEPRLLANWGAFESTPPFWDGGK